MERLVSVVTGSAVFVLLVGEFVDSILQDLEELSDTLHFVASIVAALLILLVSFLCSADLGLKKLKLDFESFDLPVMKDGKDVFGPEPCKVVVTLVLELSALMIKGRPQLDDILDTDHLTEVFEELVWREIGSENRN